MQIGLRQILLFTLCVGVWLAYSVNQSENAKLKTKLVVLGKLSPELTVVDPTRIAIVCIESKWFSSKRWRVYIPSDNFQLCVATEKIDQFGIPENYKSSRLPIGSYEIQIDDQNESNGLRVLVSLDGKTCMDIHQEEVGNAGSWSSTRDDMGHSQQFIGNGPIDLHRRRNSVPVPGVPGSTMTPTVPSDGVLLWIQPNSPS